MYEIKGSKSRSVREKNVLYSNLKNAILKGKSLKIRQKKTPKTWQKTRGRTAVTAVTAGEKKWQQIDDFKGVFLKKINFEKKSQKLRFSRAFTPKNRKFYVPFLHSTSTQLY